MSALKVSQTAKTAGSVDQPGLFDQPAPVMRQPNLARPKPVVAERSKSSSSGTAMDAGPKLNESAAPEIYRLRDLMRMFGYADRNSFRDWRRRVEAHGFPAPLPGCARPLKWDRRLVDGWRSGERVGTTHSSGERLASQHTVNVIALAREKLRLKAASRV